MQMVKRDKVDRAEFHKSARNILNIYIKKMSKYINKLKKLEGLDFYKKDRANAEGKAVKIRLKTTLAGVMMRHFRQRYETLKQNGWFERLEI